jgi:AcrR family transcriptional regulator
VASTGTRTRKTADERREEILEAAREEFASSGLHGASTDAIARKAGISQAYLFRLFGTKKELFLASVQRCFAETYETFRAAAEGHADVEALHAIGESYGELLRSNPTLLRAQMQAYAACDDPQVRKVVRDGYGRLYELVEAASGRPGDEISAFFATGMLLNVVTMMGLSERPTAWGTRLLAGYGKDV